MAVKFTSYITGDDVGHIIWRNGWYAQTFTVPTTPTPGYNITSVKLKLHRVGASPGTLTVGIRATTSNKPTGSDLVTGTTNGNAITADTDGEWIEIAFATNPSLIAGTMYAIVCRGPAGAAAGNYIQWHGDQSSPSYLVGTLCVSGDSGNSWSITSGTDEMFEVWGERTGAGGGGGVVYPTDPITRVTNLIHRYDKRKGIDLLEMSLGDVSSVMTLPYEAAPKRATAVKQQEQDMEPIVDDVIEKIPQKVMPGRISPRVELQPIEPTTPALLKPPPGAVPQWPPKPAIKGDVQKYIALTVESNKAYRMWLKYRTPYWKRKHDRIRRELDILRWGEPRISHSGEFDPTFHYEGW